MAAIFQVSFLSLTLYVSLAHKFSHYGAPQRLNLTLFEAVIEERWWVLLTLDWPL